MNTCTVEGCAKFRCGKSRMCSMHLARWRRHRSTDPTRGSSGTLAERYERCHRIDGCRVVMSLMLTRSQWSEAAWKEAAKAHGRKYAGWYSFLHYLPVYLGLALLAGIGWAAWWVQDKLRHVLHAPHVTLPGSAGFGIPAYLFVLAFLLLIGTVVAFRPGRDVDRLSVLALKVVGLGAAWLFTIGMAVSFAMG